MKDHEDDFNRSKVIKKMITLYSDYYEVTSKTSTPLRIMQYWHNLNDIPKDVKNCMDSWLSLSGHGFEIKRFDRNSAKKYISNHYANSIISAFDKCVHPAMESDYFRLCYLYNEGGMYVDSDEFYNGAPITHLFNDEYLKLLPFCYDNLDECMVNLSDHLFDKEINDQYTFYVNNNPIITGVKNEILKDAIERSTKILLNRNTDFSDIQSITGPGNLSATLAGNYIKEAESLSALKVRFIFDWETMSKVEWNLEYRNNELNWRIWRKKILRTR